MPNDKANSGALNMAPGDLNDSEHRREPTFGELRPIAKDRKALVAPDRDAEQVAFQLWREGRKDKAIAFLEREILLERDFAWKHSATRREPGFGAAAPEMIVPPPPRFKAEAAASRRAAGRRGFRAGVLRCFSAND